ncbi:MAG: hypothetical protein NDJ90_08085 [Oligoflexia bacterium]|nr:hypothetical protein [Oligoflexia bacterium]
MKTFLPSLALMLVVLCGLPSAGRATSFLDRPFPETVADAPLIARGKVGNSYVEWSKGEDGVRRLYTFYELTVEEQLKGKPVGRTLVFRELGGEKDGIGMQVSGSSRFERGEDVVVLLGEKNSEGSHDVRGLMMGKLNIRQNESGKEVLSGPALGLSREDGHNHGSAGGNSEKQEWTLESLRQVIKTQGQAGDEVAPAPSGTPGDTPAVPPTLSTPGSPSNHSESGSPAPGLQNSEAEAAQAEETSDAGLLPWLGLALAVGIGMAWKLSRRRRR